MTSAGNTPEKYGAPQLDEEMRAILQDFLVECRETMAEVEPLIVQLEAGGKGSENQSTIAVIFRLFHSMKGSAGFIGLGNIERVTHAAESILDLLRRDPQLLTPSHVDTLCSVLDFTTQLIEAVERDSTDAALGKESDAAVGKLEASLQELVHPVSNGGLRDLDDNDNDNDNDDDDDDDDNDDDNDNDVGPSVDVPPEMVEKFASEAAEQLDSLEALLLRFEGEPDDDSVVAEAFREIHSFKGNCGFLALAHLEKVSHLMEDILDQLKTAKRDTSGAAVSVLLRGVDILRRTVTNLQDTKGRIPERKEIQRALRRAMRQQRQLATPTSPDDLTRLGEWLLHSGRMRPEELAKILAERPPSIDAPPRSILAFGSTNVDDTQDAIEENNNGNGDDDNDDNDNDNDDNNSDEDTPYPSPPISPQAATKANVGNPSRSAKYIRVEVDKLDTLLNQVGELISAAASISHHPDLENLDLECFDQATGHLNRITSSLHDTSMAMRMVPLAGTFRKMLRVVRDVSRKVGKRVELDIGGEHTEVDKTVIESIADPLVHIVRNAVDHGIESPEARRLAGKPEIGHVRLRAKHQGGEVWLEVADDGAGIDPAVILEKAVSRGLVPPHQDLSKEQVFQLLFEPGFSTASAVTDISGRGVGMDVVRRNVEAIRGRVEIKSRLGHGTTFTVRLPLTLAIIDAMLLRIGGSVCALPLTSVHESFRPAADQVFQLPDASQMVKIRGRLFPIRRLAHIYGSAWQGDPGEGGMLVLVEDQGSVFCLGADEIIGQRQIVIKPLDKYLKEIRGISGCSILGTDDICLILDVASLGRGTDPTTSSTVDQTETSTKLGLAA
ncbi:MAG: chemotaxis protein CheA [Nannocystaceae bacterium]